MRRIVNSLLLVLIFALSGCYSCQSWHDYWGDGPRGAYPPDKFFWDKDCKPIEETAPVKPAPSSVQP